MRSVSVVDSTAMSSLENLFELCEKKGIRLILSHVNEQPLKAMKKSGLYKRIGENNFCSHIDEALNAAKEIK